MTLEQLNQLSTWELPHGVDVVVRIRNEDRDYWVGSVAFDGARIVLTVDPIHQAPWSAPARPPR